MWLVGAADPKNQSLPYVSLTFFFFCWSLNVSVFLLGFEGGAGGAGPGKKNQIYQDVRSEIVWPRPFFFCKKHVTLEKNVPFSKQNFFIFRNTQFAASQKHDLGISWFLRPVRHHNFIVFQLAFRVPRSRGAFTIRTRNRSVVCESLHPPIAQNLKINDYRNPRLSLSNLNLMSLSLMHLNMNLNINLILTLNVNLNRTRIS